MPGPAALIAELTHRCPLHCVYCSNPRPCSRARKRLDHRGLAPRLSRSRELGVLQLHLTGGEPLARTDILTNWSRHARRARTLRQPDHVRHRVERGERWKHWWARGSTISSSASRMWTRTTANLWAGTRAHAHKLEPRGADPQTPSRHSQSTWWCIAIICDRLEQHDRHGRRAACGQARDRQRAVLRLGAARTAQCCCPRASSCAIRSPSSRPPRSVCGAACAWTSCCPITTPSIQSPAWAVGDAA